MQSKQKLLMSRPIKITILAEFEIPLLIAQLRIIRPEENCASKVNQHQNRIFGKNFDLQRLNFSGSCLRVKDFRSGLFQLQVLLVRLNLVNTVALNKRNKQRQ